MLPSACGNDAESGSATDTVTVQLDYQVRGNHAVFYLARKKGFFADEGIEVDRINIGQGSPAAMKIVGDGQAEFGFGGLPTLATAHS